MEPAAQKLPDLTGKTPSEALTLLFSYGFKFKATTKGGYQTYVHPDGSVIHIRDNGEIVRTGPKLKTSDGKSYRRRYDQNGNQIQFIPGANTHNTGEILIP